MRSFSLQMCDYGSRFRILKGGKISLVVSAFFAGVTLLHAAPSGGVVTSGTANIAQNGAVTTINQSSQKASINWTNFSIGASETVNFNQPNVSAIALNRVVGNEKSIIDGALNANGQVWILNSNGVLFNSTAKINTSGLLATTKSLSDEDFQTGNYIFKGESSASVINLGEVTINNGGYASFLANTAQNEGVIKAIRGVVTLTGANEAVINLNGNSLVSLKVNKGVLDALVENKGAILAEGGKVYLTTNAVDELLKGVVNNTGIIEAKSIDDLSGSIELFAHGGEVQVGGTLSTGDGKGSIETSGRDFKTLSDVKIQTGSWLIDPVDITIDTTLANAISTALASADVTVSTLGSGTCTNVSGCSFSGTAGNIYVTAPITWASTKMLTLDTYNGSTTTNIYIYKDITSSGGGLLYLTYSGNYFLQGGKLNLQSGGTFRTNVADNIGTWTVVNSIADLQSALMSDSFGRYALGSNIDASVTSSWNAGAGFDPIGDTTTPFKGQFDGFGHTITGLTINRSSENHIGLFGYGESARIRNIGLESVSIAGNNNVGGIIGTNISSYVGAGYIENSYVTGTITGTAYYAGGLIGYNDKSSISNSYSLASINAYGYVGGLIGSNTNGTVTNSYAAGLVTSPINHYTGGIVGIDSGGTYSNVFWDQETTAQAGSFGVAEAKTTLEMQTLSTFDSSWDIGSETSTWGFIDGASVAGYGMAYPYLRTFTPTILPGQTTLYADGFGTDISPYGIATWQHLNNIRLKVGDGYVYALQNDLTSSTSGYTTYVKDGATLANGGLGWLPLGDSSTPFYGTFDGQNHTISDLAINRPNESNIGLFGVVDVATLKNLTVNNANIIGYEYVGGLAGYITSSTIENVNISGITMPLSIPNDSYVYAIGGAIGYIGNSTIMNLSASGIMTLNVNAGSGGNYSEAIGGLIGYSEGNSISNSSADLTMTLNHYADYELYYVGGLIGESYGDTLSNVVTSGNLTLHIDGSTLNGDSFGGILGYAEDSSIDISSSSMSMITTNNNGTYNISNIGGLIGYFYSGSSTSITASHTTGAINAVDASYVGGLIGYNEGGTLNNVYSTGSVSGFENVGGLVGFNHGTIDTAYHTNGSVTGVGDYIGGLIGYHSEYWLNDVYAVSSVTGSNYVGGLIGASQSGTFNNTYSTVSVTGSGMYVAGLIGEDTDGTITNAHTSGTVAGAMDRVGGLIGQANGTQISQSYSQGSVDGASYTGGLVGMLWSFSNITESYSTATVNGLDDVGGLVGRSFMSNIGQSYATGNVIGRTYVGGLVGTNSSDTTITNSYAKGAVVGTGSGIGGLVGMAELSSSVTNSFWDVDTSGQINSAGGTGKTTTQMKQLSMFTDATWDIQKDATLGVMYPQLVWTYNGTGGYVSKWVIGVTPVNYTLSNVGLDNSLIYDGNTYVLSNYWSSSSMFGTDYGSLVLGTDYRLIHNGSTVTSFLNAGTYADISVEMLNAEYSISSSGTNTLGNIKITPRAITLTADAKSKSYGEVNPTLTYQVTSGSVVNNDTFTGSLSTLATQYSNVGTYDITSNLANSNYAITFVDGILTIIPQSSPSQIVDTASIVTAIINNTMVQPPVVPNIVTPVAILPTMPQQFSFGGQVVQLMSTPLSESPTQIISLGEIRQMQQENASGAEGVKSPDIRIPLGQNSLIQLVNGGLRLPEGIEQEFFMAQR